MHMKKQLTKVAVFHHCFPNGMSMMNFYELEEKKYTKKYEKIQADETPN